MDNTLIDEIRGYREDIAAEVDFDFHLLFERIYQEQATQPTVNLREGHERPTCISPQQVAEKPAYYGRDLDGC